MTGYPSIDKPWLKYYQEEDLNRNPKQCTMYDFIHETNDNYLDQVCINYFKRKITYGEFFKNIDLVASAFKNLGIKRDDIVTICSITTPEIIYCLYALNKLGAVCNIVEPRTNPENIIQRINMTNSKLLVILDLFYSKIEGFDYCSSKTIITSLADSMDLITKIGFKATKGKAIKKPTFSKQIISWKTFLNQPFAKTSPIMYEPQMPAAIIYTSGTTGIPKGAVLTNDSLNAVAEQFNIPNNIKQSDHFLNIMPPFIAYGLACGIHMPFCNGMTLYLLPVFDPHKFDQYIINYKPAVFVGVPDHFEFLIKSKKFNSLDLSFIKCAGIGGDAINPILENNILDFLREHNADPIICKGYGMTEMSSAAVSIKSSTGHIPSSVGIPFLFNTVSVFEPGTDHELKYGEIGEFCITGPGMMYGYYNNEEETNKVLIKHSDGKVWVHTQDMGYMDENGFIFFKDRIKRLFVRPDGHNVWPSVIESTVVKHPDVKDCAVVGLPNPTGKNGKIPAAFVVLKDGVSRNTDEIEKELRAECLKEIPEREVALLYYFIDQIPLTPIGKVDYRTLETGDWEIGEYTL